MADQISSLELQTFSDDPVAQIRVAMWQPSWWTKLTRRATKSPLHRDFTIYRTRVCNMARAAALAHRISEVVGDITTLTELTNLTLPLIHKHKDDVIRLIACCIHNRSDEPPKSLVRYLDDNLSGKQMFDILVTCLHSSGLQSFLSATMLIKGTSANFASDTDVQPAPIQE